MSYEEMLDNMIVEEGEISITRSKTKIRGVTSPVPPPRPKREKSICKVNPSTKQTNKTSDKSKQYRNVPSKKSLTMERQIVKSSNHNLLQRDPGGSSTPWGSVSSRESPPRDSASYREPAELDNRKPIYGGGHYLSYEQMLDNMADADPFNPVEPKFTPPFNPVEPPKFTQVKFQVEQCKGINVFSKS